MPKELSAYPTQKRKDVVRPQILTALLMNKTANKK